MFSIKTFINITPVYLEQGSIKKILLASSQLLFLTFFELESQAEGGEVGQ